MRECPAEGDSTCYCIATGDCFSNVQTVDIDNCNFDRQTHNRLQIRYIVTNQAGLVSHGVIDVSDVPLTNIRTLLI